VREKKREEKVKREKKADVHKAKERAKKKA